MARPAAKMCDNARTLYFSGVDLSNIYFIGAPAQSYSEYSELDNGALKIFLSPFYFDRPAVVYGVVSYIPLTIQKCHYWEIVHTCLEALSIVISWAWKLGSLEIPYSNIY